MSNGDETRFTKKQADILKEYLAINPRLLVLYGAVRSGKTFLAVYLFLLILMANKGANDKYIIGGVTISTIKRNVIDMIEEMLDIEVKYSKNGSFKLFGNIIYPLSGEHGGSWKKVRGFTAKGALLNEATALNEKFILEVLARTSMSDSRIIMDTNPDNPMHLVNKSFIEHSGEKLSSGRVNILSHHFSIFDNEFLDQEYIEGLMASTPTGVFTDRNIYGRWVSAEGAVYADFNNDNICSVKEALEQRYVRKFAGLDWGFSHKGALSVWGVNTEGIIYRLDEHAVRYQDIDYWVKVAKDAAEKHGPIPFYCGPERPEYIRRMNREGLSASAAILPVISSISTMASLYKQNKIMIPREDEISKNFFEEIYEYVWDSKKDAPVDIDDDMMDADRYAIGMDAVNRGKGNQTSQEKLNMLANYGL